MEIKLSKSTRKDKKYMVEIDNKKIHFGATGYSDFTLHKDPKRKKLYIMRHKKRENWEISGIKTPGFWARWILWNLPSLEESIDNVERKFKIKIRGGAPLRGNPA